MEEQGILADLIGENTLYTEVGMVIDGVKLQVREQDAEAALKIIKTFEKKEEVQKIPLITELYKTDCPFCLSENISKDEISAWSSLKLLLKLSKPLYEYHHFCYECGRRWRFIQNK